MKNSDRGYCIEILSKHIHDVDSFQGQNKYMQLKNGHGIRLIYNNDLPRMLRAFEMVDWLMPVDLSEVMEEMVVVLIQRSRVQFLLCRKFGEKMKLTVFVGAVEFVGIIGV
jgi:hypothetical protein